MNLQGDFYTIKEKSKMEGKINALIELNPSHKIYEGHFPGQPIVPGVCQMQILKEFLEEATGKKWQAGHGDNIKFTGMIIPTKSPLVNLEIIYSDKEGMMVVDAKFFSGEITFTKYKGKFSA